MKAVVPSESSTKEINRPKCPKRPASFDKLAGAQHEGEPQVKPAPPSTVLAEWQRQCKGGQHRSTAGDSCFDNETDLERAERHRRAHAEFDIDSAPDAEPAPTEDYSYRGAGKLDRMPEAAPDGWGGVDSYPRWGQ